MEPNSEKYTREINMITQEDKDTIAYAYLTSNVLPVNSIIALDELRSELDKAKTNSLSNITNWKTKALCLFLLDQVYGQLSAEIDTFRAYSELVKEIKEK